MSADSTAMKSIVSHLHVNYEALIELRQFEQALNAFWGNLSLQGELMQELADDVTLADEMHRDEAGTRVMIKDRVLRARAVHSQMALAFSDICHAIRTWGIAERGASNYPRSALETPPPVLGPRDDGGGKE